MAERTVQQTIQTEPIRHGVNESARIRELISLKQEKTLDWVRRIFPGHQAAFFYEPLSLAGLDDSILRILGKGIANDIVNAFGDWYPYRNKEPEFNFEQLKNGKYLPYFGFILPDGISLDELLNNPVLFKQYEDHITLAATASFLEDENGFAELARDARRQTINGVPNEFNGGIPSLSRIADWIDNKDRLSDKYHSLFSQIRACNTHGHTPSSLAVQTLQVKNGGMRISYHAPMFVVGDKIETDYGVRRTRDERAQIELNRNKAFYIFEGNHTQDMTALWRHQLGEPPTGMNIIDVADISEYDNPFVTMKDHGENIYGAIEIHDPSYTRHNGHNMVSLNQALTLLDSSSPLILVKMPAETEKSVITQKYLNNLGFTVCGIEPSIETTYWENGKLHEYKAPITLYFARLGKRAREKQIEVAATLFLDGINSEQAIYDWETGIALRNIDTRIRAQINA